MKSMHKHKPQLNNNKKEPVPARKQGVNNTASYLRNHMCRRFTISLGEYLFRMDGDIDLRSNWDETER